MGNRTADDQIYGLGYLYGDEINLTWDDNIPVDDRLFSLTVEASRLQTALGKIRKKDPSRITITQVRDQSSIWNFSGSGSSDEFIIYVSCGAGGDQREGLKSVPALRTVPDNTIVKCPEPNQSSLLVVPIQQFKQMIDAFSKCRGIPIIIKFYTNTKVIEDREVKGKPGFIITTENTYGSEKIFEKFGDVPEDDSSSILTSQFANINIDESAIVRINSQPVLEIEKAPEPNEFMLAADKIAIFSKLASIHNEGSVRILYKPGYHLSLAHRFGAFGECAVYLDNSYTSDSKYTSQYTRLMA